MLKQKELEIKIKDLKDEREYESLRGLLVIAQSICQARMSQGLSQQKLARMCGTTQRIISNLENADINIGFNLLFRIAKELNIEFSFAGSNLLNISTKKKTFSFDISSLRKKNKSIGECVNV